LSTIGRILFLLPVRVCVIVLRNAQRFLYSFWREFFPLSLFSQNPKLEKKKNTARTFSFRSVLDFAFRVLARMVKNNASKKRKRVVKRAFLSND